VPIEEEEEEVTAAWGEGLTCLVLIGVKQDNHEGYMSPQKGVRLFKARSQ